MLNTICIQIFYRFYTRKKYEECRFAIIKDKTLYKKLLSYSGWDLFGGIAIVCQQQGVSIVLNVFFGPVVNAARAVSTQVQTAVNLFVRNFLSAVRPQVVKNYAVGNKGNMFDLTFNSAKYAYLMMLALILPICFEIDFILDVWLGSNIPDNTALFVTIVMMTCLIDTFHSASLMTYHAIGKIKFGNIVGGTLMILALPISYIVLKIGAPAYSAFIVILVINSIQMLWGWIIIHRYEKYSYIRLIKDIYVPVLFITGISVVAPFIIHNSFEQGWLRFLILVSVSEVVIGISVFYIAISRSNRIALVNKVKKILTCNLKK